MSEARKYHKDDMTVCRLPYLFDKMPDLF